MKIKNLPRYTLEARVRRKWRKLRLAFDPTTGVSDKPASYVRSLSSACLRSLLQYGRPCRVIR